MSLLDVVAQAWGFIGLEPERVLDINSFGNLLVQAVDGRVWRIMPEEPSCEVVAESLDALEGLRASDDFEQDWAMSTLVQAATRAHGGLGPDRCFCLKIPAVLGGQYEVDNIGVIAVEELVRFSGDVAAQIRDLPDGAQVRLQVVD